MAFPNIFLAIISEIPTLTFGVTARLAKQTKEFHYG
jgi:hypothetical protein